MHLLSRLSLVKTLSLTVISFSVVGCGSEKPKIPQAQTTYPQNNNNTDTNPTYFNPDPNAAQYVHPDITNSSNQAQSPFNIIDMLGKISGKGEGEQIKLFDGSIINNIKDKREQNGGLLGLGILGNKK